jgi:hypothetical protein
LAGSPRVRCTQRLELAAEIGLVPRGKLDVGGVEQHGDGRYEHHGKNVATQTRQNTPGELPNVIEVPSRRQPDGIRGLERPTERESVVEARSSEGERQMGEDQSGEQNAW